MSFMGVDVGTTGVKAVVFSESGVQLASAYEEYPLLFPFAGAAELDAANVVAAALGVVGAAAMRAADDPVRAIGIASQGEAFVPVTRSGDFLGNMMVSSDARAAPLIAGFLAEFGADRLYRITGHTAHPMHSLFKLLWLRRNRPEALDRAWKLLFAQDLVAYALTGEARTEHSMAARSLLFDVGGLDWSDELLSAVGLGRDVLPGLAPPGSVVGDVRRDAAHAMGLDARVAVVVAGHDQPVGALGCGACRSGTAGYSIGSVECVTPALDRLVLDPALQAANLAVYPHAAPGLYTTVAFSLSGGNVLKWARDQVLPEVAEQARRDSVDPYDRICALASEKPADVLLLPHFGPTGTPHYDAIASGALLGLTLATTRPELIRAILEGITMEMRWNLDTLGATGFALDELRAIGGGSRSARWMQIKADVLETPLTTMRVTEATCMGAAILAGSAVGAHTVSEASSDWAQPIHTYEPSPTHRAAYRDRFEIYKDAYSRLREVRGRLHMLKGTN